MNKSVAILGCGWLGFPLANAFLKANYHVNGSTTSEEKLPLLSEAQIHGYLLRLKEAGVEGDIIGFLEGVDILIINVPPGIRSGKAENFVQKMKQLHRAVLASGCRKLVFASSTSVYGQSPGEVTEKTIPIPGTPAGTQLLEAEQVFRNDGRLQTIVVRFGGLIGPDRHPVTFLSGRKGLQNGKEVVNLIHLDDAVALLKNVIEGGYWGEIFNGVAPEHPYKSDYYMFEAQKRGLIPPEYSDAGATSKKVNAANYLSKGHIFLTSIYSP